MKYTFIALHILLFSVGGIDSQQQSSSGTNNTNPEGGDVVKSSTKLFSNSVLFKTRKHIHVLPLPCPYESRGHSSTNTWLSHKVDRLSEIMDNFTNIIKEVVATNFNRRFIEYKTFQNLRRQQKELLDEARLNASELRFIQQLTEKFDQFQNSTNVHDKEIIKKLDENANSLKDLIRPSLLREGGISLNHKLPYRSKIGQVLGSFHKQLLWKYARDRYQIVINTLVAHPSQCSVYTTISDSTRLISSRGGTVCDRLFFNTTIVTYVRFTPSGGKQIATSVPNMDRCNTHAPGWTNATYPALAGQTVNAVVCYRYKNNTCNWFNMITITNCNSFYVFGLIAPPNCSLRYCTEK
ncbi:unnamed protein product [Didymodactylos carnosus]|uniref:UMOD/GP2/OIT3-like D8C domain-containing protein n=1 Tax=Didymodactylos carnosus TaxID=1234261 RepID=A0A814E2J5_9BILA|nr:unnamed protein product [Didymodactylos carnosus]CAF0961602.1 unnamed protein product [Didymodactylos carnosus]CAF3601572.1 unnamed protein product [Didymodactylos carnosus]CAF3736077.1 unnamed protein product [Didymodactylos carnosus]